MCARRAQLAFPYLTDGCRGGKNSRGPHEPESPAWFFTVELESLPGFKLNTVPGDESEPPHLEHTRRVQRGWATAVTYQTGNPRLWFIACLLCRGAIRLAVGEGGGLVARLPGPRIVPSPCSGGSGARGSVLNTSVLESFVPGQREEVYRPAAPSKRTGKAGF